MGAEWRSTGGGGAERFPVDEELGSPCAAACHSEMEDQRMLMSASSIHLDLLSSFTQAISLWQLSQLFCFN